MAKKRPQSEEKDTKPKASLAAKGVAARLEGKVDVKAYDPNAAERKVGAYVKRRTEEMIQFRKSLGIEQKWREADEEYIPHELDFGTTRKRFETDQDTGLRSRMVPVGDSSQQWRSAASAPTLLAKIQVAMGIIIDNQPEADLVAMLKKYKETSAIAYSLWKRNWQITNAKDKLKVIAFNQFKYGWVAQRTYPRRVDYDKRVLVEKDTENPENDKYEDRTLEWFNDVDRQPLDIFRTWIDELSKPYDQYSTNEDYYEIDYSYDQFMIEFGVYPNSKSVEKNSYYDRQKDTGRTNRTQVGRESVNADHKVRQDVVTVGFFESRLKDAFVIWVPKSAIVVYTSPLPNDDGLLSVTHTMYLLRHSNLPYGVSLWEVIRQNKQLYDKMKNMTMDQLVLTIMKFGFYSGTNPNLGDGKIEIVPGQARQLTSSTGKPEINWMEIPGPGAEAWKGLEALEAMMDSDSGISPTLEGEITGKTLGEILHAKESALKRLKTPVQNLAWIIEQDAYLTLSWMSQVYSIPTVKEFTDEKQMMDFEKEEQVEHTGSIFEQKGEDGARVSITASYYPQVALHLEDREGKLVEGKESRFFQIGKDIKPGQLRWRGIFKVIPRSIIDSSQELVKASKMELANMIMPLLTNPPELFAKPVNQILMVNEEDPGDWLPDAWIKFLDEGPQAQGGPGGPGTPPAVPGPGPGGQGGVPNPQGPVLIAPGDQQPAPPAPGVPAGAPSMQAQAGTAPIAPAQTVVPSGQVSGPTTQQLGGGTPQGAKGLFNRRL